MEAATFFLNSDSFNSESEGAEEGLVSAEQYTVPEAERVTEAVMLVGLAETVKERVTEAEARHDRGKKERVTEAEARHDRGKKEIRSVVMVCFRLAMVSSMACPSASSA